MALLHLVSAKADHTDRPKPRNVALWRRESVLPGTPHSLLSHVLAALRSLRAPPFLDPSSGTSGPSAASFCFLFPLTVRPRRKEEDKGQGLLWMDKIMHHLQKTLAVVFA